MGIRDTLHFDSNEYYNKHIKCSSRELKKKHHEKVRSRSASAVGVGVGVVGAAATAGISLAVSAFALRQIDVLTQQAAIIEDILLARGEDIPGTRIRDILGGVAIGAVSVVVGTTVLPGVENLASHAVSHISTSASNAVISATHGATPSVAASNAAHGALSTVQAQGHSIAPSIIHAPGAAPTNPSSVYWYNQGVNHTIKLEAQAITKGLLHVVK